MQLFTKWKGLRLDVVKYCGDNNISEDNFRFLDIYEWENVYDKVLSVFVEQQYARKNGLHWANVEGGFCKDIVYSFDIGADKENLYCWIEKLPEIVNCDSVYLLLEEIGQQSKYWIAECNPKVAGCVINDIGNAGDYYIVDKKYKWLITENHHGIVMFIGVDLNLEKLKLMVNLK